MASSNSSIRTAASHMSSYLRDRLARARRILVRTVVVAVTATATLEWTTHLPSQGRSSDVYRSFVDYQITPLLRRWLDPETAHTAAIYFARMGWAPKHHPSATEQRCHVACTLTFDHSAAVRRSPSISGSNNNNNTTKPPPPIRPLHVPNPIGLAAGFDKDGVIVQPLLDLGFGFVEIGTVTPQPQPGNPQPRLFRLPQYGALINRYGFNSAGADVVEANLREYYDSLYSSNAEKSMQPSASLSSAVGSSSTTTGRGGVLGINLGKNRDSVAEADVLADYQRLIRQLGPYADYLVLNISSPNTVGLRDWQTETVQLKRLLQACLDERDRLVESSDSPTTASGGGVGVPPLFVKLAPDLTDEQLREIAKTCLEVGMDGLVVSNTTNQRPEDLIRHHLSANETGGLSGTPLKDLSTHCIRVLYAAVQGQIPIVGVGGVSSGLDAYEKLRAGASLVQIYSTLVYQGPGVVSRIRHELAQHIMTVHGNATSVADIVGLDHEELVWARRRQQLDQLQQQAQQLMEREQEEQGWTLPDGSATTTTSRSSSSISSSSRPVVDANDTVTLSATITNDDSL